MGDGSRLKIIQTERKTELLQRSGDTKARRNGIAQPPAQRIGANLKHFANTETGPGAAGFILDRGVLARPTSILVDSSIDGAGRDRCTYLLAEESGAPLKSRQARGEEETRAEHLKRAVIRAKDTFSSVDRALSSSTGR